MHKDAPKNKQRGGDGAPSEPRLAHTQPCLWMLCVIGSTRGSLFRQRRLSFLQQFPEITLGKCENLELLNLPGGRRRAGGWRQEEGTPASSLTFILATGPGDGEEGALQAAEEPEQRCPLLINDFLVRGSRRRGRQRKFSFAGRCWREGECLGWVARAGGDTRGDGWGSRIFAGLWMRAARTGERSREGKGDRLSLGSTFPSDELQSSINHCQAAAAEHVTLAN